MERHAIHAQARWPQATWSWALVRVFELSIIDLSRIADFLWVFDYLGMDKLLRVVELFCAFELLWNPDFFSRRVGLVQEHKTPEQARLAPISTLNVSLVRNPIQFASGSRTRSL